MVHGWNRGCKEEAGREVEDQLRLKGNAMHGKKLLSQGSPVGVSKLLHLSEPCFPNL